MHKVRDEIIAVLEKALQDLGIEEKPVITVPSDAEHGDFTTNVALSLFKKYQVSSIKYKAKTPLDLANEIVNLLNTKYLIPNTSRVAAIAPGFINFYLSKEYLIKQLTGIGVGIGVVNSLLKGKRFMVEFAHPNTHKAFHIGHLRNITIGESIVRLLEANGARVIRANYQGDVGMHIAKALYALLQISNFKFQISNMRKQDVKAKVELLGKAYAEGSKAFGEDEEAKAEIKDLNALIYASAQKFAKERGIDPGTTDYLALVKPQNRSRLDEVYELWKETRQWSLDYFESIYKRVYTHYDRYYFESECLAGVDMAKEAVKKRVLKENEGAIIFDGKPYGLHTRVFVNSLGLPTYEAKELALAQKEFSEFGSLDKLIHVVGPEQASFFSVTFKVEELLDPQRYKDKQFHLVYGWVKLKQGKMSSRMGNVVLGQWLLDEAKKRIKQQFPDMEEEVLEIVAIGAVKYSMLKFSLNSDISFSFEESISLDGNSGPYLQYTYARTQSVLKKFQISNFKFQINTNNWKLDIRYLKLEIEELTLLRLLHRFPEVAGGSAESFSPNILCNYLFTLAQSFNLFYQKHQILPNVILSETKDLKKDSSAKPQNDNAYKFRLSLTAATGKILSQGLYLLGIEAPERM